ncbi:MAG: amidohydrolase family protein [Gammaproteobacteria bacterium]
MSHSFKAAPQTDAIRARISHPIIDADGHIIEFMPLVFDIVGEIAGADTARKFAKGHRAGAGIRLHRGGRGMRTARTSFWALPTENTLDRATCMMPRLMYDRLDELGIDFALLYPTYGLGPTGAQHGEWRRIMARAFNIYYARHYGEFRDRLEPVAVIPTFTPEEAIEELDYAVGTLGLKTVTMGAVIARNRLPDGTECDVWLDTLGHDSLYDYAPVWARCAALRVAPTFHASSQGVGFRVSTRNTVYNHVGHFAAAQEAACRSLTMGGAPMRNPTLRFGFLEGGVAWGAQLYADLLGHFDKRNREAVMSYDPKLLDLDRFHALFREFAGETARRFEPQIDDDLLHNALSSVDQDRGELDDFAESGINAGKDIVDMFTRQFYFGCEADDALNAVAFNRKLLPHGIQLNAMFASDVGHFDVPDMREVVPEAWEMVDHGLADEAAFKAFTCDNIAAMLRGVNPEYFKGTVIEGRL